MGSPAMRAPPPSLVALANGRYSMTVRYAGINKADPMRNMVRCENLPRGGLQGASERLYGLLTVGLPDVSAEESAQVPLISRSA